MLITSQFTVLWPKHQHLLVKGCLYARHSCSHSSRLFDSKSPCVGAFSFAANIVYLCAVAIVTYYFFTHLQPSSELVKFGSLTDLPMFFGTVMFAFEGVSVVRICWICVVVNFCLGSNCPVLSMNIYCNSLGDANWAWNDHINLLRGMECWTPLASPFWLSSQSPDFMVIWALETPSMTQWPQIFHTCSFTTHSNWCSCFVWWFRHGQHRPAVDGVFLFFPRN